MCIRDRNLYNNPPFFLTSSINPNPNQCYNTVATGIVCHTNGQTLETGFGAAATSNAGLEANAQLPTLFGQDQNAKSTYTESYNLGLQQSLTPTISFTLGYQGNVTRHLRVSYAANQYPGVTPNGANSQLYQPFYDFGNIVEVTDEGVADYNSLQAKIDKRLSHGLSFLAGYSWSHSLDAVSYTHLDVYKRQLWEYLRNDRLTALPFNFNAPTSEPSTAYHESIFGATLGGPILKDKLFVFADAQGTRISIYEPQQTNNTVPTAAERTGDFSQMLNPALTNGNGVITLYKTGGNVTPTIGGVEAGKDPARYLSCPSVTPFYATAVPGQNVICPNSVDAVAKTVLNLFPLPNQGVAGQVVQNYTVPPTASQNNTTQYDARVDYNFSSKDQAFARYSYSNNPSIYTPPLGVLDGGGFGSDGSDTNIAKSGIFSETHFFSPKEPLHKSATGVIFE